MGLGGNLAGLPDHGNLKVVLEEAGLIDGGAEDGDVDVEAGPQALEAVEVGQLAGPQRVQGAAYAASPDACCTSCTSQRARHSSTDGVVPSHSAVAGAVCGIQSVSLSAPTSYVTVHPGKSAPEK